MVVCGLTLGTFSNCINIHLTVLLTHKHLEGHGTVAVLSLCWTCCPSTTTNTNTNNKHRIPRISDMCSELFKKKLYLNRLTNRTYFTYIINSYVPRTEIKRSDLLDSRELPAWTELWKRDTLELRKRRGSDLIWRHDRAQSLVEFLIKFFSVGNWVWITSKI